ncbi:cyclin-D-binding Myb-like transcription factor 1 isoform X2 [Syngnathoides biaculeatus]|uniref:cyclin-D-binding Myb-like transcription factor 1 isoform X2 n=1 Tax=Syngnathoides biaculeatus TaxID=300417 RepID=UPI002ADE803F|nr:cyclin-D-binding Myb-like transcription factor 1 isoform X2 [Syngnathoides biaculeatus]
MSVAAEEQEGAPPETLKSLALTQDSDGDVEPRSPARATSPPSSSLAQQHDDEAEPLTKKARVSPEGSDGSFSLVAMPVADTRKSIEVTVTTTAPEDGAAQIQVLCEEEDGGGGDAPSPEDKAEVSLVSQAWFTTKEDKDTLANKGHKWKQGMWSKEEVDILMSNIDQYVKGRGIKDPAEIIFEMSKEERKDFYRSVASGLNRPLFAVYRRVLRMYDNRNHVGKYTPREIEKLRGLRDRHGNDWATIGAALGRSASSVKDRCRLMKDTCNTGKWSEDEERLLAQVVYEMAGVSPGSAVTGGVSWASVANRVATRSEKQCRSKWLNYLNWKHSGGTEWTRDDDLHLTRRILELDVKDENEIKWEDLAGGWSSVRSPQWLRSKWWSIKRQVTNHRAIPFPVLLKALHEVMLSLQSEGGSCSPPSVTSLQIRVTRLEESGGAGASAALQIPLQIAHLDPSAAGGEGDAITLNGGALQAFEIIPSFQLQPTGTPGTYLLQTASSQGLPLSLSANNTVTLTTSASSASHEHIIFHGLATDGLCAGDGVIIQTVASDSLIVETEGRRQEERLDACGLLEHPEKDGEETTTTTTGGFADKPPSPAADTPVTHSGMAAGGAVLIVSPPDVASTLTDPILENQDGCD